MVGAWELQSNHEWPCVGFRPPLEIVWSGQWRGRGGFIRRGGKLCVLPFWEGILDVLTQRKESCEECNLFVAL